MTNSPSILDRLESATYSEADIARLLNCSKRHVARLRDRDLIPGLIRLGRMVRYSRRIVDRWLTEAAPCNP